MKKTVAEVLKSKPISNVYSVTPDSSVFAAMKLMAEKGIGALVVLEGERLAGIVSERDYVRKVAVQERSPANLKVSDIMTGKVITVTPGEDARHCMELMTNGRLRHLPVVEDGRLIGLLSIGDLVKDIISHQENLIQHLEQYIRGE
ncbi:MULTISPECIES: CBS domain-containing protein [Pseudomonas]|jgi:CBS domain-containing protein|uniref:CBS domain-containing protein n=1 Tax=Phytopseudomonas punonensis TaxID=1220495 RepID=A0A1M6YM77_9GAMM|nr:MULTISPECIES: CBS domain-containing protein [Pseudomonas]MBD9653653.1 CBS domain-containing protein [Pseudomonas sp. PDM12]PZW49840.1 CBS domain protein [Pseudomonas sp. URMO17WK12:I2]CAH0281127.1 Inosine-5'-monophosphate dehydrogenase [Pseudomonas sp. Bi70]SHL19356.1 CBS domain-containing protein [Pseudomonas punonensis]